MYVQKIPTMNKGIAMLLDPKNIIHPINTRKPGRKTGTGSRTARLEIRCKPDLLQLLELLQKEGWTYAGKSTSDIIHAAVMHLAKIDLSECKDNEMYNKIWKLQDK